MSVLKIQCINATPRQMAKGMKKVSKKFPDLTQEFLRQNPSLANKKGEISVKKMSGVISDDFCTKKDEKFSSEAQKQIIAELELYNMPKDSTIKQYFKKIFNLAR